MEYVAWFLIGYGVTGIFLGFKDEFHGIERAPDMIVMIAAAIIILSIGG